MMRACSNFSNVPTQVGTSVYLGQTHLGTALQVPACCRCYGFKHFRENVFFLDFCYQYA